MIVNRSVSLSSLRGVGLHALQVASNRTVLTKSTSTLSSMHLMQKIEIF